MGAKGSGEAGSKGREMKNRLSFLIITVRYSFLASCSGQGTKP